MAMDMISGAAGPPGLGGPGGPGDPTSSPDYSALGPSPAGPTPSGPNGPSGGQSPDAQAADILGQMLDLATQYMQIEPDEEDKQVIAQCIANMQRIRAKDQQDADKVTQGNVTPRALRAALGG